MSPPPSFTTTPPADHRLGAIVTTLLPDFPALDGSDRDTVERDVRAYVAGQIAAMPRFLRLPFRAALAAFELVAVVRYGRRFANLPAEHRAAYVASWSGAPVAAMRDFVKLVRSTALLVYFDHALVRVRLDEELGAGGSNGAFAGE